MSSVYISLSFSTGSTRVINQSAGIGILVSLERGNQGNNETSNPGGWGGVNLNESSYRHIR